VHALCGENGAGKSTLMKILYGVYTADSGEILIKGSRKIINSPGKAQEYGLSIIFQEFNLVDTLSVAENIFLGRLKKKAGKIDWDSIYKDAEELLKHIGCNVNPRTPVSEITVAQKQMTEIAKALSYNAEIIVMDEPSATLTENELKNLYRIISELKAKGITIIYISHKMEEIFKISDRITVLRDGNVICTENTCDTCIANVIRNMVGRCVDQKFPKRDNSCRNEIVLEACNVNRKGVLKSASLKLKKGEILGIGGLVGSGRTEFVRAIFGADKVNSKKISVNGNEVKIKSPIHAIKNGIALVTEDRKQQGLILNFSIAKNITMTKLRDVITLGMVSSKKETGIASEYVQKLEIKTPSIQQQCIFLSGGNQQKTVLAKWLYSDAEILILDEPTRGIDVGSKHEIYLMMNKLVAAGKSIIMISSEMPEILGMSDRIIVMHEGKIKGEFDNSTQQITAEQVMNCAIC
jgi:ABC-type sugar transport system ATPase subunit